MPNPHKRLTSTFALALALGGCVLLSGCGLAGSATETATPAQASPGERQGSIPLAARRQAPPVDLAPSPQIALERFAERYINWDYITLPAIEMKLAASAVGEARTVEEQAAARSAADTPLKRARIYNSGSVLALAPLRGSSTNEWVIDTREQTGGDPEYAGLQAGFHITIAAVEHLGGGWAVSTWRPQN